MRMLISANDSLAIEPSGPGLPARRFWLARMLVSRRTSASIHARTSASRLAGVWSTTSSFQMRTASAMAPEPRAGGPWPPPHVGHVDLVELGLAGDLPQRPDLDARGVHIDGEVGEALVLRCLGVGAGHE